MVILNLKFFILGGGGGKGEGEGEGRGKERGKGGEGGYSRVNFGHLKSEVFHFGEGGILE